MSNTDSNVVALPKKLPIKPMLDYVLLEREKLSDKIGKSSIIIPEAADKRNAPARGLIIAAGEGCTDEVINSVGKTCYFASHSGRYLDPTENSPYFIVKDVDIIGVIEE